MRGAANRPLIRKVEVAELSPQMARVEEVTASIEDTEVNGVGSDGDGPDSDDDDGDMDLDSEGDEGSVSSEGATLKATEREEARAK